MNGISLQNVSFDTCLTILKENVVPNSTVNLEVEKCGQEMCNDISHEVSMGLSSISEDPPAENESFEGQQISTSTTRHVSDIPELAEIACEPLAKVDDAVFNAKENGKLFHPRGKYKILTR